MSLEEDGGVLIGGELIGRLDGFRFTPDPRAEKDGNDALQSRMMRTAAMRGLEGEFLSRARALAAAPDSAITLSEHGKLWWDGAIVAHLAAGPSPLAPQISLVADELLKGASRASVEARLEAWLTAHMEKRLEPLLALERAAETRAGSELALPAQARGFAHQLAENFGSLDRDGSGAAGKAGTSAACPETVRGLVRPPHHLSAAAAASRCGRPVGVALGRVDQGVAVDGTARARPYLFRP